MVWTAVRASARKSSSSEVDRLSTKGSVGCLQYPLYGELRLLEQFPSRLQSGHAFLEERQSSIKIQILLLELADYRFQALQLFLERRSAQPVAPKLVAPTSPSLKVSLNLKPAGN